jgi:hypothetical protein
MNQKSEKLIVQHIDTFFIVDFDRCLGNIEGSFNILQDVVHELGIVDKRMFRSMRDRIESNGETFSAFEYIKNYYPYVKLDEIEKLYLERAKSEADNLLEPGSLDFINFLKATKRNFCIMSFGEKRWQNVKINGSGIGTVPIEVVPKHQKSDYIRKWQDPKNGKFKIPKKFFFDNKSKIADEVVLIDDKISAFINLPPNARGYFVFGSSSKYVNQTIKNLPSSVRKVHRVNGIISYELNGKQKP